MEVLTGFNPTTQSEFWALSLDTPPSPLPIRVLSCAAPPPHHVRSGNFLYHNHCIPSPRLSPLDAIADGYRNHTEARCCRPRPLPCGPRAGGGTAAGGHRGASLPAPFYFSTALGPAARGFSLLFCPFRASGPGCFSEVQPALAHPPVFSCVGGRSDCGTLCKDHEKIKHPSLSSGDIQRSRQGGVESYGTAGPMPLFCAIFSNCDGSIW